MASSKKPAVADSVAKAGAKPALAPAAKKRAPAKAPVKASTAKRAVAAQAAVKKTAVAKKKAAKTVTPEQRANYIEVAAFYIAERRGFSAGNPEQDYLDAAAEIDRLIAAGHFGQ